MIAYRLCETSVEHPTSFVEASQEGEARRAELQYKREAMWAEGERAGEWAQRTSERVNYGFATRRAKRGYWQIRSLVCCSQNFRKCPTKLWFCMKLTFNQRLGKIRNFLNIEWASTNTTHFGMLTAFSQKKNEMTWNPSLARLLRLSDLIEQIKRIFLMNKVKNE